MPSIYDNWLGVRILSRAGREAYFSGYLQWYEQSRLAPDERALAELTRRMHTPNGSQLTQVMPAALLDTRNVLVWEARAALITTTHIRLIAADLEGSAWPDDPFAYTAAPLHRAERAGILIGAWSVGLDGVDQSGDRRADICLSLGPVLGRPLMTDPAPLALPGSR